MVPGAERDDGEGDFPVGQVRLEWAWATPEAGMGSGHGDVWDEERDGSPRETTTIASDDDGIYIWTASTLFRPPFDEMTPSTPRLPHSSITYRKHGSDGVRKRLHRMEQGCCRLPSPLLVAILLSFVTKIPPISRCVKRLDCILGCVGGDGVSRPCSGTWTFSWSGGRHFGSRIWMFEGNRGTTVGS